MPLRNPQEEKVASVHLWVRKQHERAKRARQSTDISSQQRAMLSGKIKAYIEVMCLIEDRYGVKRKP